MRAEMCESRDKHQAPPSGISASGSGTENSENGFLKLTDDVLRKAAGESELSKVVAINLHNRRISSMAGLASCPNLRTVDLSFNRIQLLQCCSDLKALRELKIYDNALTSLHTANKLACLQVCTVCVHCNGNISSRAKNVIGGQVSAPFPCVVLQ